jgi:hypothetical protein
LLISVNGQATDPFAKVHEAVDRKPSGRSVMAQYFLLVLVLGTAALFILDAGGYLLLRGTKRSLADNHG